MTIIKIILFVLFSVICHVSLAQTGNAVSISNCIKINSKFNYEVKSSGNKYYKVTIGNTCSDKLIVTIITKDKNGEKRRCCNEVKGGGTGYLDIESTTGVFHYEVKREGEPDAPKEAKAQVEKKDDFWSGTTDKKAEEEKTAATEDPFWTGEKKQVSNDNNNADDFWDGNGNKNEEESLKKYSVSKKSNQFIGEINSKTKSIRIECWDHGGEDGDEVSLLNNKSTVYPRIALTNAKKVYTIALDWGMNRIDFKALNEGASSPNTASFAVYDDKGKLISTKEWNLLTGYTATLLITKF